MHLKRAQYTRSEYISQKESTITSESQSQGNEMQ